MRRNLLSLGSSVSLGLALVACLGPNPTRTPEVVFLSSPAADALDLPFSEAVRVGSMLYLSGQLGNVPGTLELVPGGIVSETRQALENIKAALERHGSSLERVIKCTAFLADMNEWAAMNEVYRGFFPKTPPARSALGATVALDARIELECIAVVADPPRR